MPQRNQLARPMVRGRAGFHAHQAGFLPSEKCAGLCAAQPSFDGDLSGGGGAVNLKPVLGKIAPDRGNMRSGRLLSVAVFAGDHVLARECREGGRGRDGHC
jgi:hypothetical protein